MIDLHSINLGFSRKAEVYDAYCAGHPVIRWSRRMVRERAEACLGPGAAILELNAGTGVDAAYFAARGYRVHATDLADGMVAATHAKIDASTYGDRFTAQQISFTHLNEIQGGPFDLVFSNFGGLNCVPDLAAVAAGLPSVLRPGGYVVWVIMPPVCPWELLQALRGQWRTAVRRLQREGTTAHVEGAWFKTYYFTPEAVGQALGRNFNIETLQSLSLFCPPSYMENFPRRWPRLARVLMACDERLGRLWPLNWMGDFIIFTARYRPSDNHLR